MQVYEIHCNEMKDIDIPVCLVNQLTVVPVIHGFEIPLLNSLSPLEPQSTVPSLLTDLEQEHFSTKTTHLGYLHSSYFPHGQVECKLSMNTVKAYKHSVCPGMCLQTEMMFTLLRSVVEGTFICLYYCIPGPK